MIYRWTNLRRFSFGPGTFHPLQTIIPVQFLYQNPIPMNKAEYRQACEQFDKDFALRAYYIRQQFEQADLNFIFMGTAEARARVAAQLKASHETKIEEMLADSRRELELIYFGAEGRAGMAEKHPDKTIAAKTPSAVVTNVEAPSFWSRLQRAYLATFW
jgi:hypothetical protein